MPTQTIYIGIIQREWQREPQYCVHMDEMTDFYREQGDVFYRQLEAREIEMPPMPSQAQLNGHMIDVLKEQKEEVQRQARRKVKAIEERIANLVCIEYLEDEL